MNKTSISHALKDAKRWSISTNISYSRGINGVGFEVYGTSIKSESNNQQWEDKSSIANFFDDCLELDFARYKNGQRQTSYKIFLPYTSILRINVYEYGD